MRAIAVLLLGLTMAWPEKPFSGQTSGADSMPPQFANLRLGMSLTELRSARPNARKDDFPSSTVMVEKLGSNDTFASVSYDVGDEGLWRVTWSRSAGSERTIAGCQQVFETARQQWGRQYERRVGIVERHPTTQERLRFPVVVWTTTKSHAVLMCVVSKSSQPFAPNHITLTVFAGNRTIESVVKTKFIDPITDAEMRTVFEAVLPAAVH